MKKIYIFLVIWMVIVWTSCTHSYQVKYIVDNEIYQIVKIQKGKMVDDILAPQKENQVFMGWMYEGELFSFDDKIEKNMTLIAQYDTICHIEGHQFKDADCNTAKRCHICGKTEGLANGHIWIEANYQSPKTCAVCGESVGTKLFYQPVDLTYEINIKSTYLTISEYKNLKDYLKVFAILEEGEPVELSNEDIIVTACYQTHFETKMSANYVELSYNDMTICTSKILLGLFEYVPFNIGGLDVEKNSSFISSENMAQCRLSHQALEQYLIEKGYPNVYEYLVDLGWEMPGISKQYNPLTELVYVPILYYVKDGYCLYIDELNHLNSTTGEFVDFIRISKIPDALYKHQFAPIISPHLEKLYVLTRDITEYILQENETTMLQLLGKGYSIELLSFSNIEKDRLLFNIEAFCRQKNQTYVIDETMYIHYNYAEDIDIIVRIYATSDDYADITITWIESE